MWLIATVSGDFDTALRGIVTGIGTIGFVIAVVRLALQLQGGVLDRFAARNHDLEERVNGLEVEAKKLRQALRAAELRELALIRLLARNGLELPPEYADG